MKVVGRVLTYIIICSLLGGIGFFVYYSLNIYKPTGYVACTGTTLSKQTDVAVHAVRQWFGREKNLYATCPGGASQSSPSQ